MIKKVVPNFVQTVGKDGNPVYLKNEDGTPLIARGRKVPKLIIDEDNPTRNIYYGPYRYFRWYEDGKMKTRYFGSR